MCPMEILHICGQFTEILHVCVSNFIISVEMKVSKEFLYLLFYPVIAIIYIVLILNSKYLQNIVNIGVKKTNKIATLFIKAVRELFRIRPLFEGTLSIYQQQTIGLQIETINNRRLRGSYSFVIQILDQQEVKVMRSVILFFINMILFSHCAQSVVRFSCDRQINSGAVFAVSNINVYILYIC